MTKDQTLRDALHALVARLMKSANEADDDGDICCALTRRHDAVDILATLGEHADKRDAIHIRTEQP